MFLFFFECIIKIIILHNYFLLVFLDIPKASQFLQILKRDFLNNIIGINNNHYLLICRPQPVRGHVLWPYHPHRNPRLPPVLRGGLQNPTGGPCHRTRRGNGVQHGGAPGAGRLPRRSPHQEDQSGTTGKSVQTTEGCAIGKVA